MKAARTISLIVALFTFLGCGKEPQPKEPQPQDPEESGCSLLRLGTVDFSSDKIHIVNNPSGKPIALVTLEYLGEAIGRQAILVYTKTSENKWKTDSIYVAKVTLVEKGLKYVEPEECCSGGHLKFHSADMTYFYQDVSKAVEESADVIYIKESSDGSTYLKKKSNTRAEALSTPMRLMMGGHTYPLVKIAGSIWQAENLMTTKFPDGTAIPQSANWSARTPNMGWPSDRDKGSLYNSFAAERIAPDGWRVPTGGAGGDWNILADFAVSASALKKSGTNITGFSIEPLGRISSSGVITRPDDDDNIYWTSTEDTSEKSIIAKIFNKTEGENIQYHAAVDKRNGFGVRLVKNFQ